VAALEQDRCAYLAARQLPEVDLYLSFTGGPLLTYLTERFGVRCPRALYCAVDAALYQPQDMAYAWDLGYLGTYAPDRQPALERLLLEPARRLPECRFVVAGPQYANSIAWPANVERIEHLPPAQHVAFYGRQRFTLNVTRADMVRAGWSPSVRLFEAAACGAPIISDRWEGLDELMPDRDAILIADDADDVVRALCDVDDARRIRIGQSARDIVLADHTGLARARELEQHLRSCMDQTTAQTIQQPGRIGGICL
jgi:spore maturation protein CgeB